MQYAGVATVAAITACDLMTRLYQFSDDSMLGRAVGTPAGERAAEMIASQARRMGLSPAGDNGGFLQRIPLVSRAFDSSSTISAGGVTYHGGRDFLVQTTGRQRQLSAAQVMFAGRAYDTTSVLPADSVRGMVLILRASAPPSDPGFALSNGFRRWRAMVSAATATIAVAGEVIPETAVQGAVTPGMPQPLPDRDAQLALLATAAMADSLLGAPVATATFGLLGKRVRTALRIDELPRPASNVVAVLPGSDPQLRHEYVVLATHYDGLSPLDPRDHDSLRVSNAVLRPMGSGSPFAAPTAGQRNQIAAGVDSLRKLRPPRIDSIYNGADDGGSGTAVLLEMAESLRTVTQAPRRSIVFVWHTGAEPGEWGSRYFLSHSPVPLDSVIAMLYIDQVGRGAAQDAAAGLVAGVPQRGGLRYVQVVGDRRLAAALGDAIDSANHGALELDRSVNADGHPLHQLCRGDRTGYEAVGIPSAWFTTGAHSDFHQVTDEAEYIDYDRMAQVSTLVLRSALIVANMDHRIALDRPRPDRWTCPQ
jgi:hypothetical protein